VPEEPVSGASPGASADPGRGVGSAASPTRGADVHGLSDRIALVIPTWNGGPRWQQVMDRWQAQSGVGSLQMVCPDSGSNDGSEEVSRVAGAEVIDVPPAEFSHGGTRNMAVEHTDREFVILTVQDALPLSTTLAADLVAPLAADPTLCATFGRQVPLPGCHPVLKARIGGWAGGTEIEVQELGMQRWKDLDPWARLKLIRYDHVIAAMRREVWERHAFAPVSFGEDVDWARRVIQDGGRIAFVPGAAVEHSHDRPAWDEARRIYCDHRNLKRLVGLVAVPSVGDIGRNVAAAQAHYEHLVDTAEGVDDTTRARWRTWAQQLAKYENWAQYLGANYGNSWWFAPVDLWLRRGI
jgi:rhamnosyltransferase